MLMTNLGFALTTIGARQEARTALETGLALSDAIGSLGAVRHAQMNLLGWAALAVPAGFTRAGLPAGLTLIGPGGSDRRLCKLGMAWQRLLHMPLAAEMANLSASHQKFVAGRSMRDVEPSVALKPRDPWGAPIANASDLA
jgi:hypothetical protein